jgi:endo-1,4-beta-xylanase
MDFILGAMDFILGAMDFILGATDFIHHYKIHHSSLQKQVMKKSITILLTFFCCSLFAQDAYHIALLDSLNRKYSLPTTPKWFLPNTETATFSNVSNFGGTTTAITPVNTIFYKAQQRTVSQGANAWDAQHRYITTSAIAKGDRCLMVIWLRSTTPNARVNIFAEHFTTYNKEINATLAPTSTWKMYLAPFESTAAYAIGELNLGLHLASANQTIEVGGVACMNFEKTIIFNQLPLSLDGDKYGGSEPDAPWRVAAEQSIEQLRKANFTVKVVNGAGQAVSGAEVRFEMTQHAFKFGSAVVSNKFNGGSALNAVYEQKMLDLDGKGHGFNEIVFENDHKWNAWEQHWFSSQAEIASDMAWLKSKDISVRGHNLVWPAWQYSPTDITAAQTPDYIKNRIKNHLTSILGYPGVGKECIDWDVLNEIVTNNEYANRFANTPGYTTGRELYTEIYKQARSLAPNSKLYLNDYIAIEQGDSPGNGIATWKQRIDELLAQGAPIDGIGFQGHFSASPTGIPRVKEILDEFWNKYQLEAKVTEYDIGKLASAEMQAKYMRDILTISFAHPSMKGFIMWGFWDGAHWLGNAPIYNQDWTLKPSGTAFIDQVFTKWWKDEKINTALTGEAILRGFKGKYKITVKLADGKIITQTADLDQDKTLTINTNGTGVQDLNAHFNLTVVPNPATSPVKIAWQNTASNESAQLQIRNSIGVLVFEKKVDLNEGSVEWNSFQKVSGFYFITLKTNIGLQTLKLIVP